MPGRRRCLPPLQVLDALKAGLLTPPQWAAYARQEYCGLASLYCQARDSAAKRCVRKVGCSALCNVSIVPTCRHP